MTVAAHQYIDRDSGEVRTETLFGDRLVNLLYSAAREDGNLLMRVLTSNRLTDLAAFLRFDLALDRRLGGIRRTARNLGVDFSECVAGPDELDTPRKLFERRIRYWECRPMPRETRMVVSPADSRILVGTLRQTSHLWIKEKLFAFNELLGFRAPWIHAFHEGDFAVFRLTPDKYHYNHMPVSGIVREVYEIPGGFRACNPGAMVRIEAPLSRNRRVVTIIDTDVKGGTGAGLVAMIEIVALMIGDIHPCYSNSRYDYPVSIEPGMFLKRGQPKSLFRPGSSTDVLMFQKDRIEFATDLLVNRFRSNVASRFSLGFGQTLVETDVKVRSHIASALEFGEKPNDAGGRIVAGSMQESGSDPDSESKEANS